MTTPTIGKAYWITSLKGGEPTEHGIVLELAPHRHLGPSDRAVETMEPSARIEYEWGEDWVLAKRIGAPYVEMTDEELQQQEDSAVEM